MNSVNVLKRVAGVLVAGLAWCAMADAPVISDVVVRQRWPWSRLVDIDYVLTGDPTDRMDVLVTAKDGSVDLVLPPGALSGNLFGVASGPRRIIFDPTQTVYTNSQMLTQFSVTLQPAPVPLYMIVDLTKAVGADGQIEYVYPGDARLETYGRFTNVWFGVTNDVYKTDKLVLRRVHAGTYYKGSGANVLTIVSNDFYVGVFELTQGQWERITGSRPSSYFSVNYKSRPAEQISYNMIRGATNDTPSIDWSATAHTVAPGSFIDVIRTQTGLSGFDLPSDQQWEYVCRAGTTTYYNDGMTAAPNDGYSLNTAESNMFINVLGRYKWNGGKYWDGDSWESASSAFGPTNGTAVVGSYLPNAWGLYDTHGNVLEWCLDKKASNRILRGGSWSSMAATAASGFITEQRPDYKYNNFGLRLVLDLP